ncbi:ANK_REP_REGION domain-containing protein [Trichoderma simmonsii]|uniref:ANK_REP_REGION domain-containing protein n=1 Tax=Trichoderma simmonsii TaxID=1491479 RepID=A0A8G0L396_9HYPO|nr:ANK_REP_REGION domain-containing protein [Trichoderma simmonsii]
MSDPNNYTIGWISAIEIEYIAAQAFLDERHKGPRQVHKNDENFYTLGRIGNHNVVITVLPRGDNGVAAAAMAAKDMMHTFPNVRVCLMVGIGGGAPSKRHDIRLGDVVVSIPTFSERSGNLGGVVQYDYGRTIQKRCFQGARYLNQPDKALRNAANGLSAKYKSEGNNIDTVINDILAKNEKLRKEYSRPDPDSDKLYSSDPVQTSGTDEDLASELVQRPKRSEKEDNPAIHYGLIASADGFMEDAQIRDILAEELDVLCFEMEAAGLMNSFPCLVIRGICDYSDRHWFKEWRGYAAMTAAAYAKALLEMVPAREVNTMQTISDLVPPDLMERARNFIAPLWGSNKKDAVPVPVIAEPKEVQTKDRSKDQPYQMLPTQPAMEQPSTLGGVDPEETQSKDSGKDRLYQMSPTQPTVAQSPIMGGVEFKETLGRDRGIWQESQDYQMPPNQTATMPPATNGFTSGQTEIKHVYIAVMGVTGAGKSSLISLCTGKNVKIGHNLESCTADVEDVEFMLNDHVCVHLIDTPGFDDTSRSDVEVLQNIALWLKESFEQGTKLSGIIYLHRIIDVRMAGSTLRNLSMFKKLCGEEAYSSVVLATSMWSQVDETTGAQRERELIETKKFWGYMHDKGSKIFRLNQTRESCLGIIKYILSLGSTTLLELQDEIVNQGRQIEDTEAGVQLNEDIIHEREKHQAELVALKAQMQEEMAEHDAELQRALREEYDELKENIRRSVEEQAKLKQDLKDVHERKERELLELKKQMEAERKKYDENQKRQAEEDAKRAQEDARRVKAWAEHRQTPLHLAVQDGKADLVESLLMQGDNIEAQDTNGKTPLHLAVLKGNLDMTKLLLDRGANIEAKKDEGRTPLFNAVCNGNEDMAKLLLTRGADIEAPEFENWTALHVMAANGRKEMVKFLLDHGANIEPTTNVGGTPLGLAIEKNQEDVAKLLLNRGADIDMKQRKNSWTMLHLMVDFGTADMVNFLIDHGANIEAKLVNGCTPFGLAIERGKEDMAKLLLNRGADINMKQRKDGNTSLHLMVERGETDMVKLLLDHGANIEAKNDISNTPLGLAVELGKINIANILLNRGANIKARQRNDGVTSLHLMAEFGKLDMVEFLLDHGADIEAKSKKGHTPLSYARDFKKVDVIELLLDHGARA